MEGFFNQVLVGCGLFLAGAFLARPLWAILKALRSKLSKNIDNFGD